MVDIGVQRQETPAGAPPLPSVLLPRTTLLERLDRVEAGSAMVVCAPSGYGKTTLVAHWARSRAADPITWISGGDEDDSATVIDGATGSVVVDDLATDQPAATARRLIAAAARSGARLVLLLRCDITHELADLRLAGSVDVLHARDLALSAPALAELIEVTTGHTVADDVAHVVREALGGWPAGAVAVAARWDPATSRADHRERLAAVLAELAVDVAGLVVEAAAPEHLASLTRLSSLPALGGGLWDDLLGRDDGTAALDALRTSGAFLSETHWHPDLLRLHPLAAAGLRSDRPDDAEAIGAEVELVHRAAAWYLDRRLPLLAAWCHVHLEEWDSASQVIFEHLFDLLPEDQLRDLLDFLAGVPIEFLRQNYQSALGIAGISLTFGRHDVSVGVLDAIGESSLLAHRITAAVIRGNHAGFVDDPTPCVESAELGLRLCDEAGDDFVHDDLYTTSYTRHWRVQLRAVGMPAAAYVGDWARFDEWSTPVDAASMVEIPPLSGLIPTLGRRSHALSLAGRATEAFDTGTASLALAPHGPPLGQTAEVRLGIGEALRLRGDLEPADESLRLALELLLEHGRRSSTVLAAASLASVHLDRGQPDDALLVLDAWAPPGYEGPITVRGRHLAVRALAAHRLGRTDEATALLDHAPRIAPVAAAGVQIGLERGRVADAQAWLAAWPEEPTLLAAVLEAACRAATAEASGDRTAAFDHLRYALGLAGPEHLVQPIAQLAVLGPTPVRLLAQEGGALGEVAQAVRAALWPTPELAVLSDRERVVLHHLATSASLTQLASRLVVSRNTLGTQTKAIYAKLDVPGRAAAVALLHPR